MRFKVRVKQLVKLQAYRTEIKPCLLDKLLRRMGTS